VVVELKPSPLTALPTTPSPLLSDAVAVVDRVTEVVAGGAEVKEVGAGEGVGL
jgi:hypothetical protein